MKNRKIFVIITAAVIVAAAAAAVLLTVNRKPSTVNSVYTCPMHPEIKSDRPGSCPICGMDLVIIEGQNSKVESQNKDNTGGRAEVFISPEKQQLIGVKTGTVEVRELGGIVTAPGVVAYDPELYYAQQEYISALKSGSGGVSRDILENARIKLKSLGFSEAQIKELGSKGAPSRALIQRDGAGNAIIYARVYQDELGLVKNGNTAEVVISSAGRKSFLGNVIAVDPVLDPETRSAKVRIQVSDREGALKPEMYVEARIFSSEGKYLSIPEEAVLDTGTRQIIFVAKGDGHFEPRLVSIGQKKGGFYVLESGASAGETVVTNANFLIDSESRLKAALAGMGGGHEH